MIREVAVEELKPSVRSCSVLLGSLQELSLMHGLEFMNFGLIQQVMGSACVVKGDAAQAQLHHQRAMAIFEVVFEDEPVLLEEKRKEIGQATLVSRQKNQKLLV